MSLQGLLLKYMFANSDRKRDAAIPLPDGVTQCRNISYGSHGKDNLLDVYYPDDTTAPCPPLSASTAAGMFTAIRRSTAAMVWIWPAVALHS